MQFVLDCSVAISWCLLDENDDYANALLEMMPDYEAFVPLIWSLEVANTLCMVVRSRLSTIIAVLGICDLVRSLFMHGSNARYPYKHRTGWYLVLLCNRTFF
jgi:hypothetical protein